MTRIAILCSGQGTQTPEMFDILAEAPEAADILAASAARLGGRDPRDAARAADSHDNRTGQILCCTMALAAWAALGPSLRGRPLAIAGYSVGELAAWGVAGLFDPKRVLDLAVARAEAMDAATREPCGLIAISGLDRAAIDALCATHGLFVSIVNGGDRFILGGPTSALTPCLADAEAKGAQRTVALRVGVASHTPLLREAAATFASVLDALDLPARVATGTRLLSGIDATAVRDPRAGAAKLAEQIATTIDWAGCLDSCRSFGVTTVLELGPGNALSRMMQDVAPDARVRAVSDFKTIDGVRRWLDKDDG